MNNSICCFRMKFYFFISSKIDKNITHLIFKYWTKSEKNTSKCKPILTFLLSQREIEIRVSWTVINEHFFGQLSFFRAILFTINFTITSCNIYNQNVIERDMSWNNVHLDIDGKSIINFVENDTYFSIFLTMPMSAQVHAFALYNSGNWRQSMRTND